MSHFPFSISFPKNKVSALIPRESPAKPTPFPFPTVNPASREQTSPDARISKKPPPQPNHQRAHPTRTMSLLEKASSNPESSSSEEKKFRHIIRKPLGRRSEGNLKAASKGKRAEEQHPTTSFDVPPPPPPKDPVPVGIPIKGRGSDKRASQRRGKILHHIPGFSDDDDDDDDDAKTFTTQSVTSDSDAASSLQTPSTPADFGSLRSWEFSKSPYEPAFTIEKEDRAIEPCNALTPPPIHHRRKSPVIRLP